jgi:hypothetical protein
MATLFSTGNELNADLERIFETAHEYLVLISPYIKLHERYASVLKEKKETPDLKITIVFGKNEEDISKSMKVTDFNFFKDFPNIEIRYEKRLHAKYYANEEAAILTSMNLYNYSQNNNIEAGVLMERKGLLGSLTNNIVTNVTGYDTFENQTADYFDRVIKQAELLFLKVPHYEPAMFGLSKRYVMSVIEKDILSDFFERKQQGSVAILKESFDQKQVEKPNGYCIRTGIRIKFDPKNPMCDKAYQSWSKFSNKEIQEKFCHFSGEPSNGETTYSKPILRKNWSRAKEIHHI